MKFRKIEDNPDSYVLIFDAGDELLGSLNEFAQSHKLSASSFKAIGALSSAKLGWYNPKTKAYDVAVDLTEQLELLSLTGDIGTMNGKSVIHSHAVIGRHDGSTVGGHLLSAIIHPTCELFLVEYAVDLVKAHSDRFNLNLFKL